MPTIAPADVTTAENASGRTWPAGISLEDRHATAALAAVVLGSFVITLDSVVVRSYRGTGGAWYRHATEHPRGRIRAGPVERGVTFDLPDGSVTHAIDGADRAKCVCHSDAYLMPMVSAGAVAATLTLTTPH